jgi:DNA-binding XRE family transcriptional regulator
VRDLHTQAAGSREAVPHRPCGTKRGRFLVKNGSYSPNVERVRRTLAENRRELGISQRELAAFSGVSATTIRKAENGLRVDPALVLRLAVVLAILEHHELRTLAAARVVAVLWREAA